MILTGPEIKSRISAGEIIVDPYVPSHVGPNSVDLTLGDELQVYIDLDGNPIDSLYRKAAKMPGNELAMLDFLERRGAVLDVKTPWKTRTYQIPDEGFVIWPGRGYLARTVEHVATDDFVPFIEGRSSIGRSFVSVHCAAGFGDIGFHGTWTLEITCTHPIRIYAGMRICQVAFEQAVGDRVLYGSMDRSKYQDQLSPQASKIHEDF